MLDGTELQQELARMNRRYQARGLERRNALIEATRALLIEHDVGELTFAMVAKRAGVPESSAYHFFENRHALFEEVANQSGQFFGVAITNVAESQRWEDWQTLVRAQIDACLSEYEDHPIYQRLLVALSAQPDTYKIEHEGNLVLAEKWFETLQTCFEINESRELITSFRIMIECLDAIIRLSINEHAEITPALKLECKRMAVAYLGIYLPTIITPALPLKTLSVV